MEESGKILSTLFILQTFEQYCAVDVRLATAEWNNMPAGAVEVN